jgi:heme/copper-type cytochrome/quinol oxidase subunit 2
MAPTVDTSCWSRRLEIDREGDDALAVAQHVVMALILTGVLICQARTLSIVLRSRRSMPTERRQRIIDMVWITIPLVAVVFLAVRSWILVLDLGALAAADPSLAPQDHSLE